MPILVRPMLAKTFGAGPSCQYMPGHIVQPKLNGIRALYQGGTFVSRDGEVWASNRLLHLKHDLKDVQEDIPIDGELYIHDTPLQTINSYASVKSARVNKHEPTLQYHIFDIISRDPCVERLIMLKDLIKETPNIRIVPSYITRSNSEAELYYRHFKSSGFEGMMYRDPWRPYAIPGECPRQDLRVAWLLKRKEWLDLDGVIVGMTASKGKHFDTMSSFWVEWEGKRFEVSSGPTDAERQLYWSYGQRLAGQRIKIEYRELTKDGIPFHERIVFVELPPD